MDNNTVHELQNLKVGGHFEDEVEFLVKPPYSPTETVGMISWDYAAHFSIPKKSHERMREHFASTLGYNLYCFGIVAEVSVKQHNFLYGEEHPSKGSDNVASIVFYYLRHVAPEHLRVVEHLVV